MVPSKAEDRKYEKDREEQIRRARFGDIVPSEENITSSHQTNGHSEQNGVADTKLSNGATNGEHKDEQSEQNGTNSNQ